MDRSEYWARALIDMGATGFACDSRVENYEDIIWEEGATIPDEADVVARADELEAIAAANIHQDKRAMAYPSLRELADALYWQAKGDNTKMDEYIAQCDAVKEMFPKGQ